MDYDVDHRLVKLQSICGIVGQTLLRETREETRLKCYKVMAVPVLYGSETWVAMKKHLSKVQASEMRSL